MSLDNLLQQVVEKVNQISEGKRPGISAYTQILAGLKYRKDLIQQLFREGIDARVSNLSGNP
ncbi:hypothetical protein PCC6912_48190 [Chlorogloeopsis fritschii PCC 6912]|uniref:Uncharacterized protein n=1 Tax=Chlorogloeopsis fritschii PCC 6912 TaxID=211165 RepID=A0A433N2C2_CHLFR|nr:hypothetical protein [Chlorogloeopsis fritschii]RUR75282.1 hypothetical protein PCC6912_48190 [Chlorogloeopsis fritschii PCC 6912]